MHWKAAFRQVECWYHTQVSIPKSGTTFWMYREVVPSNEWCYILLRALRNDCSVTGFQVACNALIDPYIDTGKGLLVFEMIWHVCSCLYFFSMYLQRQNISANVYYERELSLFKIIPEARTERKTFSLAQQNRPIKLKILETFGFSFALQNVFPLYTAYNPQCILWITF